MDNSIEVIRVNSTEGLFAEVQKEHLATVFDQLWAYYLLRDACPCWKRNDN
jgi:hypothetical protein